MHPDGSHVRAFHELCYLRQGQCRGSSSSRTHKTMPLLICQHPRRNRISRLVVRGAGWPRATMKRAANYRAMVVIASIAIWLLS
jgi:hypothetical protein